MRIEDRIMTYIQEGVESKNVKRSEDDKKIISNELKELKINQDEIKSLIKEKDHIKPKIAAYKNSGSNAMDKGKTGVKASVKVTN